MHSPTVSYAPRTDATQEAGLNVRASVYRFILDSRAKKNAAGVISTNGDDRKDLSMIAPAGSKATSSLGSHTRTSHG